ncbi:hypothetical protein GCK32_008787, partial [Trichostrongylus colubriformis]
MRFWQTFLIYAFLCLGVCWAMRKQGVAVRGTLKCGPVPANNSKVRIVDIDYGIDPDDTLDEKRTDETGHFEVTGWTREMTPIDPVLYIWHECMDEQTMRSCPIFLYTIFLCFVFCGAFRKQGVAVRGVLKCGTVPAVNSKVRIVDIDYGIDPDDTLDEQQTDQLGRFQVSGTTRELTPIDPVLYIWHECRDEKNMHVWQSLLLFSALLPAVCWAMRKQGVAVRGVLKCGAVPAKNTKVRIIDVDYDKGYLGIVLDLIKFRSGPDPDDTLDEKHTDSTGRFELSGTTREMTPIDPVLYIWHDCLDEQK